MDSITWNEAVSLIINGNAILLFRCTLTTNNTRVYVWVKGTGQVCYADAP